MPSGIVENLPWMQINHLVQISKSDMEEIRSNPSLETAYKSAETAWEEYRTARQETIKTSQEIGEGDLLHPLATNVFSNQVKRVQVIDNDIKIK